MRRAYWAYLDSTFEDDSTEQAGKNKRFWTYIKHQKSSNVGVAPLKEARHLVSDPKGQADILNRHFQSVFGDGTTYSDEEFSEKCQMPPCDFPVLDKIDISERGVMKLLCNLTFGKAFGPDNITP